jgi:hypothetical protein
MKYLIILLAFTACGPHDDPANLHDHRETQVEKKTPRVCYYHPPLRCVACEYHYRDAILLNCID